MSDQLIFALIAGIVVAAIVFVVFAIYKSGYRSYTDFNNGVVTGVEPDFGGGRRRRRQPRRHK